jgi:hypothetical protein
MFNNERIISNLWKLVQELAVWATEFACLLRNLISKFRKDDIKLIISWTIEKNLELSLYFMWMTSINTFESLVDTFLNNILSS